MKAAKRAKAALRLAREIALDAHDGDLSLAVGYAASKPGDQAQWIGLFARLSTMAAEDAGARLRVFSEKSAEPAGARARAETIGLLTRYAEAIAAVGAVLDRLGPEASP